MATRMLRYLTAALVAGFALSLAPATPASADEPGYRTKRVRMHAPRVRTVVQPVRERVVVQRVRERVVHVPVVQTRTVERVRTRTRVVCYDYTGQPFDCRTPAPVAPEPQPVVQVVPAAPQPVYYTCGGCAPAPQPVQVVYAAPATGCGGCAPAPQYYSTSCCGQTGAYHGGYGGYYRAAPYRWAVRHAHRHVIRHAYKHGH